MIHEIDVANHKIDVSNKERQIYKHTAQLYQGSFFNNYSKMEYQNLFYNIAIRNNWML